MTTNEPDFLNYLKTGDMEVTGQYDIPVIKGIKLKNLDKVDMIGFNYATSNRAIKEHSNDFIHFFLPDHYIERVWDNVEAYEPVLGYYKAVVQPDFSQYIGMHRAMLIWQHYRRMWLAAYLQRKGMHVIPAPCWSDEESFEYCFDGMPKHSCLCISTVGCMQSTKARMAFNTGFKETLKRLKPSQLILYGKIDDAIRNNVQCPYVQIDSDMKKRINRYKNSLENS